MTFAAQDFRIAVGLHVGGSGKRCAPTGRGGRGRCGGWCAGSRVAAGMTFAAQDYRVAVGLHIGKCIDISRKCHAGAGAAMCARAVCNFVATGLQIDVLLGNL